MPADARRKAALQSLPSVTTLTEPDPEAPPNTARFVAPQRTRAARLLAVQALYQHEMTGTPTDVILQEFQQHRLEETARSFGKLSPRDHLLFADIVRGVGSSVIALDEALTTALSGEHQSGRLEVLLRTILRCGLLELRDRTDVDAPIIINEYVDIAHAFYGGREPGLVNAVLDRSARTLRDLDG